MSTIVITRAHRTPGPPLPQGEVELQEPPALPETQSGGFRQALTVLPMVGASSGTLLTFSQPNSGPLTYLGGGMMALSMGGMFLSNVGRNGGDLKAKMKGERRDYLRYLAQLRKQTRKAAAQHREAVGWDHPDPSHLWTMAMGHRLWERRPSHDDFADVRIGTGDQRCLLRLVPPQTKPVEDLDPLCASALRRFIRAYTSVSAVPTALHLPAFPAVELMGEPARARGLARAMLAQLATLHSPDDVQIAVLAGADQLQHWQWIKWLPHALHPHDQDAAGPVRLCASDYRDLVGLLGNRFEERPAFYPDAGTGPGEPFVVIVNDGVPLAEDCRLTYGGLRNVIMLRLTEDDESPSTSAGLRLRITEDQVEVTDGTQRSAMVRPDQLSVTRTEALARVLSPLRTGGVADIAEPLNTTFDLSKLLGINDARGHDVHALWRTRARGVRLRVPIGIGEDGSIVELDIKESAQGGMGPHGVLIGATGSGKSELLRTLVIALAATHSSEILNFVLTDFKGGATFMGMDALPHTSAVITNLADELPLVDRMQDSLHGEMIRRQELLRRAGYSSLKDYEKARADGASLDPLPTLFIVVDEFSELLATKPEFMELFVMIGRLGRSLGVHLLLASQRLEEGRIHALESHLSYRIALRTFSASESRSVIGVSDAYELPSGPGNGFLKMDTTTLVRFKASYVSGPYQPPTRAVSLEPTIELGVEPIELRYQAPKLVVPDRSVAEPEPATAEGSSAMESLFEVFIKRLRGQGPPARQVWLPPLAESPSLDQLLPGIVPDPVRGLTAVDWLGSGSLRVPVGVVDRPFDQLRDLLIADLGSSAGHVGVVGGTQSGKSTLVRSLLMSLALTHTPTEVQFYCLDFGGGTLASLAELPHMGSVASRLDRDRVKRTVSEMLGLMQQREQRFIELGVESMAAYRQLRREGKVSDPYGDVFLVVDGWFTLRQDFDDLESRFTELASRGLSYGIHLVIAAARWSEIRPWLRDVLGTRFELRLGDTIDSEIGSRIAAGVPTGQPGRGLTTDTFHFLAALPRVDGASSVEDLSTATKSIVSDIAHSWSGPEAPEVRLLPAELPLEQLPAPEGDLRVAIGWDEQALRPVWHDFDQIPHLMVFGDSETGKTNLLRLLIRAVVARYSPAQARILVADFRRQLHAEVPEEYRIGYAVTPNALRDLCGNAGVSMGKRMPGPEVTPDQLKRRDWWQGPRLFVVIDDYDLAGGGHGGPLEPLVEYLAQGADIGMHLLLARSTSGAMRASMDPVIRRMWELGTPGLLLSYPKEEGKFLGEAKPLQLPPGRAQLVTRRSIQLVQTALVSLPEEEEERE